MNQEKNIFVPKKQLKSTKMKEAPTKFTVGVYTTSQSRRSSVCRVFKCLKAAVIISFTSTTGSHVHQNVEGDRFYSDEPTESNHRQLRLTQTP